MQIVYIGLLTLDCRCFQGNFGRTLSRFTVDNRNSSVLKWCHLLGVANGVNSTLVAFE